MTPNYKSICPLCEKANACGLEEDQSPCWCMADNIEFSEDLLDQVPEALRNESCICERCLRTFNSVNRANKAESEDDRSGAA